MQGRVRYYTTHETTHRGSQDLQESKLPTDRSAMRSTNKKIIMIPGETNGCVGKRESVESVCM